MRFLPVFLLFVLFSCQVLSCANRKDRAEAQKQIGRLVQAKSTLRREMNLTPASPGTFFGRKRRQAIIRFHSGDTGCVPSPAGGRGLG